MLVPSGLAATSFMQRDAIIILYNTLCKPQAIEILVLFRLLSRWEFFLFFLPYNHMDLLNMVFGL